MDGEPDAVLDLQERWYYCLTCERLWHAATWRLVNWACPSTVHYSWPEFHPHIGWSHIRDRASGLIPTEGGRLVLAPVATGPELPAAR